MLTTKVQRRSFCALLGLCALGGKPTHAVEATPFIDKQKALDAQSWWDNRDWDWYKSNIPFFDCPDKDLVTTWYYRWELITKHLTYGSPNSGYTFTEFIDRPFWSGTYGAISCPVGHQLYELRWLRNPQYASDYSRYWFRTPGAQPRNYGCWLADGIAAVDAIHPAENLLPDLLPDLKKNYEGWEKRQFVPEVGLFWQNGHDDGMEFNINSRQTKDILRGANGYRPGFNAYMYADALAIVQAAERNGDTATAQTYKAKAASLKANVQKLLWDPKREFFFPMSMRDETDADGNIVKKHTLTYQSGKYAGSPHGREEHGYIPWQFGMVDAVFESAWKFLMDPNYFFAPYGPMTVERNDPQYVLKTSCCWWSGQSWPYATAQTLKAMANLLHHYKQSVVSAADYVKLLHILAISHRKDGIPYLAEALNPDNGSFLGHDAYNHSEHYFHSSFNDLIITGLVGLNPRTDNTVEIAPLAPAEWDYFALEDVAYRGQNLTIVWDQDGTHYGKGKGLQVWANGKRIGMRATIGKLTAKLPGAAVKKANLAAVRLNYAVNNDADYYPRYTSSFTDPKTSLDKVCDGHAWYTVSPPNRWTTQGSPNAEDWVAVDFGVGRKIDVVRLALLDDGKDIVVPAACALETFEGNAWRPLPVEQQQPEKLSGHRYTAFRFAEREVRQLRARFTHGAGGFTGLSEIEAWGAGVRPYVAPAPKAGNLAYNPSGKGFPQASASFHDNFGGLPQSAFDGRIGYKPNPINRWTSFGSPNATDWLEVDFGEVKAFGRVELGIFDDRGGVQAPASYRVEAFRDGAWQEVADQKKVPAQPTGGAGNTVTFPAVSAAKVRVVFTHQGQARSGVTEMEVTKD